MRSPFPRTAAVSDGAEPGREPSGSSTRSTGPMRSTALKASDELAAVDPAARPPQSRRRRAREAPRRPAPRRADVAARDAVRGDRDQTVATLAGNRALVAEPARARRRRRARDERLLHRRRRRASASTGSSSRPRHDNSPGSSRRPSTSSSATARACTGRTPPAQLRRALSRSRLTFLTWGRRSRSERAARPLDARRRDGVARTRRRARAARARAGRDEPGVPHWRIQGLRERLGTERAAHLLLGRRPVPRRPLARHPAGRSDQLLHPLRRQLLPPLRSRRARDRLVHERPAEIVDAGGERLPHALRPELHPRDLNVRDHRVQGETARPRARATPHRRSARGGHAP